jgi:hypothetical protein
LSESPPAPRRALVATLVVLGVAGLAAAALIPRNNYDAGWTSALDSRAWLGIPSAGDVLTNAPFLLAGAVGLGFVRRQGAPGPAFDSASGRACWLTFFLGVLLTGFTSTWFHLAPSADRLLFDRLTLVIACEAAFCAVLAERASPRAAGALLPVLALVAAAATLWWWRTAQAGAPDLRWYGAAQALPIVGLIVLLAATPSRDAGLGLWWLIVFYGAAKAAEALDVPILHATGVLSGHSLKHLFAGAAAWVAYVVLRRRVSP